MISVAIKYIFRLSDDQVILVGVVEAPLHVSFPVSCELFVNGEKKPNIRLTGRRMPGPKTARNEIPLMTPDLAAFDGINIATDSVELRI